MSEAPRNYYCFGCRDHFAWEADPKPEPDACPMCSSPEVKHVGWVTATSVLVRGASLSFGAPIRARPGVRDADREEKRKEKAVHEINKRFRDAEDNKRSTLRGDNDVKVLGAITLERFMSRKRQYGHEAVAKPSEFLKREGFAV